MIKSFMLTLLAFAAAPTALAHDCMNAFEQAWNPPPFECPFGFPNPQCLWTAQIAYEQYMQMASFTLCESLQDAAQGYQNEIDDCMKYYNLCINAGEYPNLQAICLAQLHDCVGLWLDWYNATVSAAYTQFYQDLADAQDQFYTAALDCCPQ